MGGEFMPHTKTPLRYPGGKTQLSGFVSHLINENEMEHVIYCEPYSGGFGAGLELLFSGVVEEVIINDLDLGIYSLWYAIIYESQRLIDYIQNTCVNISMWNKQKEIYHQLIDGNAYDFKLAFATLFLNRTNRSGIITGGPIGGKQQLSKYTLDCRFNKDTLIKKIKRISKFKNRIHLYNLEANTLIKEVLLSKSAEHLFIFFDPPYYNQGKNLYKNFFVHENHEVLRNHIDLLNHYRWIATYDYEEPIRRLYQDFPTYVYTIRYSVNRVRKEKEYLFHSPAIKVTNHPSIQFI